jgi:hypothetical protein
METLPITPDTLHDELTLVLKVLHKWEAIVDKGIPGIDLPATDAAEAVDRFRRELSGELMLIAGKCQSLSVILGEG